MNCLNIIQITSLDTLKQLLFNVELNIFTSQKIELKNNS